MIEIDGSEGEGGGQILRTALTLSMITGTPFRISNIRARRNKPGLLRQHMTAVQAAAEICQAQVNGATPGSLQLEFTPGAIQGGNYEYVIGTAGSCTLVLQTVLPALWFAQCPSTVTISGGTHNPSAPPVDFLIHSWLPLLEKMGIQTSLSLLRHGFYPVGGGSIRAEITPCTTLKPLALMNRGPVSTIQATALLSHVPYHVGERELARLQARLGAVNGSIQTLSSDEGPGNALLVKVICGEVTETFTSFGARGVSAESVAEQVASQVIRYQESDAAAGEYLADQLLLPMALAGQGTFTTSTLSSHLQSNCTVIEKFLPVSIQTEDKGTVKQVILLPRAAN